MGAAPITSSFEPSAVPCAAYCVVGTKATVQAGQGQGGPCGDQHMHGTARRQFDHHKHGNPDDEGATYPA